MYKSVIVSFLVFFCAVSTEAVQAQNSVEISDSINEHVFTGTDVEYLEDPKSSYVFDEISTELRNKFRVNKLYAPHNQHTESTYWIRIRIMGNTASSKKWILEFFDQTTDYIEAYIPANNGLYSKITMGETLPFRSRKFRHKNFEIELPNKTNEALEYYFKVKSANHVNIIIALRSYEKFIHYALNEYLLFGFFYGMILVVSIYNILMYFAIREREYLVYILYLLSVGVFTSCADGVAFQYLWPNHPEWNNAAYGVALYSVILWSMVFAKMFLHTSEYPVVNKIINYTIAIRTLIFIIAFFFYQQLFEYRWIEFMPLSVALFSGMYVYKRGFKAARFFALAYCLLFIAFIVKIAINLDLGFIPGTIVTHYSITISFWCEMILLSFALTDKVRILKDSRNKALQEVILEHEENQLLREKVNRELETEVKKRTEEISQQKLVIEQHIDELKIANKKLSEQAMKITKMNTLLDVENYKLQKNIKEEVLARIGKKNMAYNEFKEIFPDELTCLRYLDKKWENGYACRKCQNEKHLPGKNKFDKRCSRCGYSESPTAFTIFQGLKFPIEKAFYILHLVISNRDDLTIDDISATLGLRRNTCWAFKDKVTKIIKAQKHKKKDVADWDALIFKSDAEMEQTKVQSVSF
jgi:two-component system, sensor histidine kinase LadS